jgi:hypothetical protein
MTTLRKIPAPVTLVANDVIDAIRDPTVLGLYVWILAQPDDVTEDDTRDHFIMTQREFDRAMKALSRFLDKRESET